MLEDKYGFSPGVGVAGARSLCGGLLTSRPLQIYRTGAGHVLKFSHW
jgi:hypothetical protein